MEAVWTGDFVAMLEKGRGKTEVSSEVPSEVSSSEAKGKGKEMDLLSQMLSNEDVGNATAQTKVKSARSDGFGASSAAYSHVTAREARRSRNESLEDPTEELMAEINKIKERMSILPIRSAGALFGPGEGVIKIYKDLKAQNEKQKAQKKQVPKRILHVKPGGFALPKALLTREATEKRNSEMAAL